MTQTAAKPALPVAPGRMPGHVAIIMDGNGRWARQRGLPRFAGHRAGAGIVRTITQHASDLGLKQLTLYSFSTENWNRPAEEINLLMDLYVEYMQANRDLFMDNNIQFAQIGRREGLPQRVLDELGKTLEMTKNNSGMTMCLAINYGSRAEITDAVRAIAEKIRRGELAPQEITQELISAHLYTAHMRDPDLLIRTAGEMRVSNYLLWQISYAEIYVTSAFWPDFDTAAFDDALRNFATRQRRFGGVDESNA
jgi:undecaprenyl diphosphate synthase